MPRFVILRHELPAGAAQSSHWDVMFECDSALRTWSCQTLPDPEASIMARQLPDHRLAYLEYEGPVSGGRGSVARWDQGDYELLHNTTVLWHVRARGARLAGDLVFSREHPSHPTWRFTFLRFDHQTEKGP